MAATKNANFATNSALIANVVTSLSASIYHPTWLATMNAGTNICIRFRLDLPSLNYTQLKVKIILFIYNIELFACVYLISSFYFNKLS